MSALENLPPDQRAVLQLVLQRGRSYDEIAQLLSIDRSAVRQRALDAFDALTPSTVLPGPEQALVTDYLLGQLPEKVAEQVHSFLQASEADRSWAVAIVDVISPLVSHPLPEVPGGGFDPARPADQSVTDDPEGVNHRPAASDEPAAHPGAESPVAAADSTPQTAPLPRTGMSPPIEPWRDPRFHLDPDEQPETRPLSRRGGAILLSGVGILIAVAILVAVLTSGGAGDSRPATNRAPAVTQTTSTSTTPTSAATDTGSTTSTTPRILAQLNLASPNGARATVGIVQVVRVAGKVGIVVDAQGVPANTAHNAYAVWLYNSPSSHRFVGFVPTLVGSNGKLATEGQLPSDAASYHRLLITLETQSKPASPGEVVLSGPFRERP